MNTVVITKWPTKSVEARHCSTNIKTLGRRDLVWSRPHSHTTFSFPFLRIYNCVYEYICTCVCVCVCILRVYFKFVIKRERHEATKDIEGEGVCRGKIMKKKKKQPREIYICWLYKLNR